MTEPKAQAKQPPVEAPQSSDLGFSSKESFGLFMEGLRAIQIYSDESDKNHPRQELLKYWISKAESRLRECVAVYPSDPLPRYYLGVAMTMRNQNEYVERLNALKNEFVAMGSYVRYEEQIEESNQKLHDHSEWARKHAKEDLKQLPDKRDSAKSDAARVLDLDKDPWPLLHEAETHFCFLRDNLRENRAKLGDIARNALLRATTYNLAEVYSRLGRVDSERDDIEHALMVLRDMPTAILLEPHLGWTFGELPQEESTESISPAQLTKSESTALDLQARVLTVSLQVRHSLKKLRPKAEGGDDAEEGSEGQKDQGNVADLDMRLKDIENLYTEINQSVMPSRFKVEVKADYWIKRGYLTYEQALSSASRLGKSSDELLYDAAKYLNNALTLKPNWNPAQIYLALVFAVHAGVAEANGEKGKRERYYKYAEDLFTNLLGLTTTPPAPSPTLNWHVEGSLQASPQAEKPKPEAKAGAEPA